MLPCMGDGRQSGTSDTPSILNASPESAAGGNLAILQTGDRVKVDLRSRRVDVLLSDEELAERRRQYTPPAIRNDSPWQELYRAHVGQLETGALPGIRGSLSQSEEDRAAPLPLNGAGRWHLLHWPVRLTPGPLLLAGE